MAAPQLPAPGETPDHHTTRALLNRPPLATVVREWWAGLSDGERRRLERDAALLVGNLDGVPWPARIRANHVTLERTANGAPLAPGHTPPSDRDDVTARVAAALPGPIGAFLLRHHPASRRAGREARVRERIETLRHGPGLFDRQGRPRYVLAFDPELGAATEYLGPTIRDTDDPYECPLADGIAAVAVFVPGNESSLTQFDETGHTMSEIVHLAAEARDAEASTANIVARQHSAPGAPAPTPTRATGLIVWQDGRFPTGPKALSAETAGGLARPLAHFVNSIVRAPSLRVTAVGFSFGGSVVGLALRAGMRVDAVVHLSSAGLGYGVAGLDELPQPVPPHYALLAAGDTTIGPIQGLQLHLPGVGRVGHGRSPVRVPGVVRLEAGWLHTAPDLSRISALEAREREEALRVIREKDEAHARYVAEALAMPGRAKWRRLLEIARGSTRRSIEEWLAAWHRPHDGVLRGHTAVIERWGTTAKRNVKAVVANGPAELAAPRSSCDHFRERFGLPQTPITRPGYVPLRVEIRDGVVAGHSR